MDFFETLIKNSHSEGFPLAGALDLDLAFTEGTIQQHISRYDHWIEQGRHGAMEYLRRGQERRADPKLVFQEAQSILCVGLPYPTQPAGAPSPEIGPRYARYLQGPDYHVAIAEKLERVLQQTQLSFPDLRWKICVDTSAVLERSWAALAGLGWIGKNTLLIHPRYGSYFFLGEVLLNFPTGRGPAPIKNLCGHCSACLQSCPTKALIEPGALDSNRCISYWTLEKRGDLNLDPASEKAIGPWIAGCDLCQEACPFNRKPSKTPTEVLGPNATTLHTWEALTAETTEEYKARIKNSALNRIKPDQFKRNLALCNQNLKPEPVNR
jgi:epoxyqueuosine reductase